MVLGAAVEQWLAVQSSVAVGIILSTNGGIPHPSPPPYFSRVMQSSSSTEQLRHALCLSVGRRVAVAEVLRRGVRSELRDANVCLGGTAGHSGTEPHPPRWKARQHADRFVVSQHTLRSQNYAVTHSFFTCFIPTKCVMDYLTHHATMVHKTSG